MEQNTTLRATDRQPSLAIPTVRYCLYARKSTESEERQILSIDSQVKEMLQLAEKEGLEIAEIKRESHSVKDTGKRPIFNEIVEEIKLGKFNGILTWAPDRISRNAGDLGRIVDLMDQKLLVEIRTYGQRFTNMVWAICKTIHDYNHTRIHTTLKMPPAEFSQRQLERSSLLLA